MKLKDYRAQKKLTLRQMADLVTAKLIGERRATVSLIYRIEGGQLPDREVAAAILAATDSEVGPADFYEAA